MELCNCITIYTIIYVIIVAFVAAWIYFQRGIGQCHSTTDLTGKTVLITGANCGIGFMTALHLARRNARVVLACRNKDRAEKAKEEIIAKTGNTNVVVRLLDLCSLKSVRDFAKQIIEEEPRLDILINNAGTVSGGKYRVLTEDGLETLFATNYFGPFLLTNLLLDLMKCTPHSRIINVSSVMNNYGNIDLQNLNAEKSYSPSKCYAASKLAMVLFTRELARKLEGSGVTANVLHPGVVNTDLFRNLSFLFRYPIKGFVTLFCKTPEEGAQTSLHLALSDDVKTVSGKYFADCRLMESGANPIIHNKELAEKLWKHSCEMTGLSSKRMDSNK
ncbi:retinol dehydrogenase 12 [Biomphalaria pfeifferi]|uniref:Retinol dehydrogenase 12 n=1 Tax=Biomphalaria pfeifferi TaxID=112525 RepID=A0AAD8BQB4_BIOPF|nr:retinol dehydrogenase 12 [Biomphalaria pfeifferi]